MLAGRIDLLFSVALVLGAVVIVTDLIWGRIFNWITLPVLVAGLACGAWLGGIAGFGWALAGAGAGLVAFGWLFFAGAMGGGDVKLLMALGALGGPRYALETALVSVMVGGAMAFALLVATGRIRSFIARMQYFLLTLAVREMKAEPPQIDRSFNMPFGIPIAISAALLAWRGSLAGWGLSL